MVTDWRYVRGRRVGNRARWLLLARCENRCEDRVQNRPCRISALRRRCWKLLVRNHSIFARANAVGIGGGNSSGAKAALLPTLRKAPVVILSLSPSGGPRSRAPITLLSSP